MIADIQVSHHRSAMRPADVLPLCDKLGQALADLSPDGEWPADHVQSLIKDLDALRDKLDGYYVMNVNGYSIGDRVELFDQTVAKIAAFLEGGRFIEFARSNGTKGRAEIAYIKGRK